MGSKIVKLAIIRDNENQVCPFGLRVPTACSRVGRLILSMTPVLKVRDDGLDIPLIKDKDQLAEVVRSNTHVLMWGEEQPCQCIFANKLFEDKPKVECNYGDAAAGIGQADFIGMPSYTQYFSSGYSSVPIAFYSDHPVRNQSGNFEVMMSGSFASEEGKEKIKK